MLVEGTVRLRVMMGTWLVVINMDVDFLIVDASNNAYNAILERTSLNKVKVIVSIRHLLMKFPMPKVIGEVQVDQVMAKRCYMTSLQDLPHSQNQLHHGESSKTLKAKLNDYSRVIGLKG